MTALLIPVHLATAAPAPILAMIPGAVPPPPVSLLQPTDSAFAQQPASIKPHPPAIPKFDPPTGKVSFSAAPTDRELITAHCFEEPLAPQAGNPLPNENADLARALTVFCQSPRDVSPLTAFLDHHPDSRWKASLLLNLGLLYRLDGYWSRALAAFEDSWSLCKNATDPLLKADADRTLGELAQLNARLGRMDRLDALFAETKGRDVRGAGTDRFEGGRANLSLMHGHPDTAFRCGPLAIGQIFQMIYTGPELERRHHISLLKSTTQGTNLASLQTLANEVGLAYQAAFRTPGAPVIVPSLIHWKVGHFAALTKKIGDNYLSQDRTFGVDTLVSAAVLDAEASGYFLVPAGPLPQGWRAVGADEAKTIFGKGIASPNGPNPPPCNATTTDPCQQGSCNNGMAGYNLEEAGTSLMLSDTPVGYAPPFGPAVKFTANYDSRESAALTNVSNLGNKWCFDWLSYIQAPSTASTVSYGPGGGQLSYNYDTTTNSYTPQTLSQNRLVANPDGSYTLYHPNGAQELFNLATPGANPRIFRTKYIDPQGNALTYGYDSYYRLVTVTDAIGQTTVISYENSTDPTNPAFYNITKVTDPFGRFATFHYNNLTGQLTAITDILGITSSFTYGFGDFVTTLTTPYGTSQFAMEDGDIYHRWLEATDPLGAKERIEFNGLGDDPVPGADPVAPAGFYNGYLPGRNTFYWDKKAMESYVPGDPNNYTQRARITHFLHGPSEGMITSVVESTKEPFENRVWNAYDGQRDTIHYGTTNQPKEVARILDDGSEQDYLYQYNAAGNVIQSIDPNGRETDLVYDTNNIDLLQVRQKNGSGFDVLLAQTFNSRHEPLTVTDASDQVTHYAYNSAGQVSTVTNAKNETTSFYYDPAGATNTTDLAKTGYLVSVVGPVAGATMTFTYDGFGRVQTVTDSEGYTVTSAYDAFDRPTTITYPDGTTDQVLYKNLDPEWVKDRLGRWTHLFHDALRHLVMVQDPLLRKTVYEWCNCGSLAAIVDPAGNRTTWMRDVQSRLTQKIYPDNTAETYAYENTTSRLKSKTDAKSQVANYQYYLDNTLKQVSYTNAVVSTPTVGFTYDPVYLRLATMTDGIGTTNYTYNPVPASGTTTGANQLATVSGPLANSTIAYTYDELGRVTGTTVNGSANAFSVIYDALGRVQSATNPLGNFTYGYVNQTGRLQSVTYPNGQVTNYSYYPNSAATPGNDDQRLSQIQNLKPGGANLSTFGYTYNAVGLITSWSKQLDTAAALTSNFQYDAADQLIAASVPTSPTAVSNYSYGYDLAGNRTREQIDPSVTTSVFNNLNQLTGQSPAGSMAFTGTVNKPATVTLAGNPATVDANGNWRGSAPVAVGSNSIPLVATDLDNPAGITTKTINITVSGGASRTLTYDLNGNLINDGAGKTYTYDAANRQTSITQGGNISGFVYDGLGRRVQETLNGTLIKQWVWCPGDAQPCEERDASNNVTKRFYAQGEQINGTNYFYTTDHLGSVREMTDSSGAIRARYDYTPYGTRTKVSGDLDADFGFDGMYYHQASGLYFTLNRAYDPNLGRWTTRDPAGENGGINLYDFTTNDPINAIDPLGLCGCDQMRQQIEQRRAFLEQYEQGQFYHGQGEANPNSKVDPMEAAGDIATMAELAVPKLEKFHPSAAVDGLAAGWNLGKIVTGTQQESNRALGNLTLGVVKIGGYGTLAIVAPPVGVALGVIDIGVSAAAENYVLATEEDIAKANRDYLIQKYARFNQAIRDFDSMVDNYNKNCAGK